jgi:CheY-like chemotaxis protein
MSAKPVTLVVDDSENDIFLLRRAFKRAGIRESLHEVHNGEEAIAYLLGQGVYADRGQYPVPSLVLLDLNMPMKNGFDVLSWARAEPAFKRLAIYMLTASMRTEDVERAFDLGASSYLVKPSSLEEFTLMLQCMRDWMRHDQFARHWSA